MERGAILDAQPRDPDVPDNGARAAHVKAAGEPELAFDLAFDDHVAVERQAPFDAVVWTQADALPPVHDPPE